MKKTKVKIVTCHKCERDWPRDQMALRPMDDGIDTDLDLDRYHASEFAGRGYWTRDVVGFDPCDTGSFRWGAWHFIGPCCEMIHSGPEFIDDAWPPPDNCDDWVEFDDGTFDEDEWLDDYYPDGSEEVAA